MSESNIAAALEALTEAERKYREANENHKKMSHATMLAGQQVEDRRADRDRKHAALLLAVQAKVAAEKQAGA